jgi:preprotein translocase subunit SecD
LNELAAASFAQPPPQNQAALVLNGKVLSAPAFQTTTFDDRVAIAISGGFSRAEAKELARLINRS